MTHFSGKGLILSALALAAAVIALPSPARADLLLVPQRIVFEEQDRAATLTLVNNGNDTETYRISWKQLHQLPDGQYTEIQTPGPGEHFADDMIRYSPRQITLAPGEQQTVRLMLRKPADLPTGEYRSHLAFTAEPRQIQMPAAPGAANSNGKGLGVQLAFVYGVSIPVIVRQGQLNASATLAMSLKLSSSGYDVLATIGRSGTESLYGDLVVDYRPPSGKPVQLQEVDGVSVLLPNTQRSTTIGVTLTPEQRHAGGQLQLIYRAPSEAGGGVLAETQKPIS
jgi:P pilus assembly chaperone PapD